MKIILLSVTAALVLSLTAIGTTFSAHQPIATHTANTSAESNLGFSHARVLQPGSRGKVVEV
jgi:hypothetical protein